MTPGSARPVSRLRRSINHPCRRQKGIVNFYENYEFYANLSCVCLGVASHLYRRCLERLVAGCAAPLVEGRLEAGRTSGMAVRWTAPCAVAFHLRGHGGVAEEEKGESCV